MPSPVIAIGDVGNPAAFHIGDEAMFDAFVRDTSPDGGWVAISADPAQTTSRLGVPAVACLGFSSGDSVDAHEARLAELLAFAGADAVPAGDPAGEVLRALDGARALLVTGGGNLSSTWPDQIYDRVALIALARRRGLPVVVTGQTLGPQLRGRERARLAVALSQAALVGVREPDSHRLAMALGVAAGGLTLQLDDGMFLADEPAAVDLVPARPWIAVTVKPVADHAGEWRLLGALTGQLERLARETGARIAFLPHEGTRDGALVCDVRRAEELARRLERLGVPVTELPMMEPAQVAALTRRADLVISSRYHPLVFGLGGAVPCLGLYIDDYTRAKAEGALGLAGLDAWTMHVEAAAELLADAALELWGQRADVRRHLEGLLPGWREGAARHKSAVLAALGGSAPASDDVVAAPPGPQPAGSWTVAAALTGRAAVRAERDRDELERHASNLEASFREAERYALSLRAALDVAEQELAVLRAPRRRRRARQPAAAPPAAPAAVGRVRLHDLRHEQVGDSAVASMALEGGTRIALRRHGATLDEIDRTATPFVPLAAILAAPLRWDAHVDGPVDETARAGAEEAARLLSTWFAWRAPRVTAAEIAAPATPSDGTALFFSRGLDSMSTFARERDRLDALIGMSWEDAPFADAGTAAVWRGTVAAAAEAGKPLLRVSTNARDALEPVLAWDFSHGAALASLALLVSPSIGEALIAGAFPVALAAPAGTHPELDHLWSSSSVRIASDEGGGGRNEKAAIVGADPFCARWLNVCWERPAEIGCGRCCKCIITMTNFKIAGRLDAVRDRFAAELTPESVMGVALEGFPTTPLNARLVLERLDQDDPLRPPWEAMLARALAADRATAREQQAACTDG